MSNEKKEIIRSINIRSFQIITEYNKLKYITLMELKLSEKSKPLPKAFKIKKKSLKKDLIKNSKPLPKAFEIKMEYLAEKYGCIYEAGLLYLEKTNEDRKDIKTINKICDEVYKLLEEYKVKFPIEIVDSSSNPLDYKKILQLEIENGVVKRGYRKGEKTINRQAKEITELKYSSENKRTKPNRGRHKRKTLKEYSGRKSFNDWSDVVIVYNEPKLQYKTKTGNKLLPIYGKNQKNLLKIVIEAKGQTLSYYKHDTNQLYNLNQTLKQLFNKETNAIEWNSGQKIYKCNFENFIKKS